MTLASHRSDRCGHREGRTNGGPSPANGRARSRDEEVVGMPAAFTLDLDSVLNRRYRVVDHVDPRKTALIVVDMQRFFLEPGQPAYLPGGDGAPSAETVVENTVKAVDLCRRAGIQVIW